MTELELIERARDMRDKNIRYECEIASLEEIIERLGAERTELENIKADLEKIVKKLDAENNELKNAKADLEDDNRYLAKRVELLEHKRDELIDELKRVGNTGERDFMAGQLIAYRQVLRMILDRGKE